MSEIPASNADYRVLVFAPIGRDTELTVSLLRNAAIACQACHSLIDVRDALAAGAGAVLLTEEALSAAGLDELAVGLASQPAWSDISVLLFAGGSRSEASLRTLHKLEVLRNVTLLDRPIRTAAVLSTVRAALRGRERQYELRDTLTALHKARVDAEHANRLKDEFLATVSHELRTPLNAILGWVAMLQQAQFEAARVTSILEIVERNAKAQAQLIADVLDVSRMISGRVKLELAPVSLGRIIHDAVDSVRPGATAKGITLELDVTEGPVANVDADRMQQVMWNLLSNACKFTPAGGRIEVTLRSNGSTVSIFVTDTGTGIPAEFLPYVFDRFRQADQGFTRSYGGLGLGLAIVKHLVEMHGGQVLVSSDGVGKGARFAVHLPIAEGLLRGRPGMGPAALNEMAGVDLADHFILVVDDDQTTRDLLATILTRSGGRVKTAENARVALAQFDVEVPGLVLADIGMPEEDGLSMMRRIRQRPPGRGGLVRSIALSAYARAEDRDAALAAGYDEFLTKPIMPADVVQAVGRWLGQPRGEARDRRSTHREPRRAIAANRSTEP